jgi:hypothetical protein
MMAAALLIAAAAAGWLVIQARTGGWRRIFVRVLWRSIMRSCGAAVRRDRVATKKLGPGEKVSQTQAVEHCPILWGLFGRPIGPRSLRLGARWRIWAAQGQTIAELQQITDRLAATTWCSRAVVERRNHRSADLVLLWRDPFRHVRAWYTPLVGRLNIAFDIHGNVVDVPIVDSWGGSWLIGAAPGSGKSAWINAILRALVGQPAGTVNILGVDLKRVELGPWEHLMAGMARTPAEADRLFRTVRDHIDRTLAALEERGLRHVPEIPTVEWPYIALVIDELGALLSGKGDAIDDRKRILAEIAMLGRAAGVIIVAAVQRPTTDLIPGQIRDNLQRRVLLRVANLDAARAVLGWVPTQAEIDQLDQPGLALVDLPGRPVFLARSTFGEVADIEQLALAA